MVDRFVIMRGRHLLTDVRLKATRLIRDGAIAIVDGVVAAVGSFARYRTATPICASWATVANCCCRGWSTVQRTGPYSGFVSYAVLLTKVSYDVIQPPSFCASPF